MKTGVAFALVLALATLLASLIVYNARRVVRDYLRFAAILYFALAMAQTFVAAASMQSTALAAADFVNAMAPVSLMLALFSAFEHPPRGWIAAVILLLGCVAGLFAAIFAMPAIAFASLFAAICAMLALSLRRFRKDWRSAADAIVANVCMAAGAASSLSGGDGGGIALALFSAAGLLGTALAVSRSSDAVFKEQSGRRRLEGVVPRR